MRRQPTVVVLVGDCLRAADATDALLPFAHDLADVRFERCYAPSTWTLPAHASLYAGRTPAEHGVTRRGDALTDATLPERARQGGYTTALFSENPTFSTHYGFDRGIDYVDDFVDSKLVRSDFAMENHVREPSLRDGLRLLRDVARSSAPAKNLLNALYGPLAYASLGSSTEYPHHGDRVLSHLGSFLREREGDGSPSLSLVNLLDPHNPHHAPPDAGAMLTGLSLPDDERRALGAANDNKRYLLERGDDLPRAARSHFDSWEAVLARRHDVYRAQVRGTDRFVEAWAAANETAVEEALVVVTGDHGQLFGAEGMVGHHTSLHPHGVQVPLLVSFPDSWAASEASVSEPVGWLGLSAALCGVVSGEVDSGEAFVERVREASRTAAGVPILADGPTWNVSELRPRFDDDLVDRLCVRKVGFVEGDRQVVYSSPWESEAVERTEYRLADGTREEVESAAVGTPSVPFADWLVERQRDDGEAVVSDRLKQLGYL
ncbi:sulfatase-like hydrolase/transferase [Halomarina ordinaria]|uniref:Sulfatase-like hydrolase/transferase n=1 Tax=Halomarina ordinaria TaxID=3033939 RepID=A0ABD5U8H8_9EURY|nr:sulfatase-like hydrolase/transferase [Halomarina sp. PSRA2]